MAKELTLEDLEKDIRANYMGKDFDENKLDEPFELTRRRIRDFSWGLSDDNPLFCDPAYAARTRWECQLAPPTIASAIRYPQSHLAIWDKPYNAVNLVGGCKFEWFNVFRVGDRITTSLMIADTERKEGKTGPLIFVYTEGNLWNQHGDLIAKQRATQIQIEMQKGAERGKKMVYEQEPYKYSKEEIKKIVDCYDAETRRGSKPLYWDEVKAGDKLQTMVRGPLTLGDMIQFNARSYYEQRCPGTFRVTLNAIRNSPPDTLRTNPKTNWPYEDVMWEHYDTNLVQARNLPLPFDLGCMRYEMAGTVITNWMGDDGFLRRLDVQIRRPVFYGDTTWFSGEVVNKYKVTEGGVEYNAVDVKIEGVNQLGLANTVGTATAYLPAPGREVQIPIPAGEAK